MVPDFKGEFKSAMAVLLSLTVTDHASRFLMLCEALEVSTREEPAITAFERLFRDVACRSPSAPTRVPFASPNALFNLSKLSVWWLMFSASPFRTHQARSSAAERTSRAHAPHFKKETNRLREPTACSSRNASMPLSGDSTSNGRMRRLI